MPLPYENATSGKGAIAEMQKLSRREVKRRRVARGGIVVIEWNGAFGDFQFTTCHGEDRDG